MINLNEPIKIARPRKGENGSLVLPKSYLEFVAKSYKRIYKNMKTYDTLADAITGVNNRAIYVYSQSGCWYAVCLTAHEFDDFFSQPNNDISKLQQVNYDVLRGLLNAVADRIRVGKSVWPSIAKLVIEIAVYTDTFNPDFISHKKVYIIKNQFTDSDGRAYVSKSDMQQNLDESNGDYFAGVEILDYDVKQGMWTVTN